MILMRLTNSTLAFSLPSSFPSLSLSLSLFLFCTKSWFPEWESCILGRPTSPVMFARSIRLWALIVESVNGDAAQLRSDLTWYRQKSVHFNAVTKQKKTPLGVPGQQAECCARSGITLSLAWLAWLVFLLNIRHTVI